MGLDSSAIGGRALGRRHLAPCYDRKTMVSKQAFPGDLTLFNWVSFPSKGPPKQSSHTTRCVHYNRTSYSPKIRKRLIQDVSDEIGIVQPSPAVWLCLGHSDAPAVQRHSSCTGTLQLGRYQGPRWPQAARWAQCTYIDIHFFSGRQKTSSSISIFGQILITSSACNYLNTGKV
jgi:hypothetical protein